MFTRFSCLLCLLATAACSSTEQDPQSINPLSYQPDSPAATAAATVAQQTGSLTEDVVIRSMEAVEFSDSSLGCPRPGMAYMQVITPGYKIVAEAAGKSFDVRVAGNRGLICDQREIQNR